MKISLVVLLNALWLLFLGAGAEYTPGATAIKSSGSSHNLGLRNLANPNGGDDNSGYSATAVVSVRQLMETAATAEELSGNATAVALLTNKLSNYLYVIAKNLQITGVVSSSVGEAPALAVSYSVTLEIVDKDTQAALVRAEVEQLSTAMNMQAYLDAIQVTIAGNPTYPVALTASELPTVGATVVTVLRDPPVQAPTYSAVVSMPVAQFVLTTTTAESYKSSGDVLVSFNAAVAAYLAVDLGDVLIERLSQAQDPREGQSAPCIEIYFTVSFLCVDQEKQDEIIEQQVTALDRKLRDEQYMVSVESAFSHYDFTVDALTPMPPEASGVSIDVQLSPPTIAPTPITESAAYQKSWRDHRAALGAGFVGICVLLSAMYMYCCPKKKTPEEELAKKKRVDDTARQSVALVNMGLASRAAARIEMNDLESAEETTKDAVFTSNPMRKL